jgi:hypothetical protein
LNLKRRAIPTPKQLYTTGHCQDSLLLRILTHFNFVWAQEHEQKQIIETDLDRMEADNSEWASEPIAIIGMSCKFSGGANSPDQLWDLMASGKTGWSEIPKERFDLKGIYHPNHERTSTVCFMTPLTNRETYIDNMA